MIQILYSEFSWFNWTIYRIYVVEFQSIIAFDEESMVAHQGCCQPWIYRVNPTSYFEGAPFVIISNNGGQFYYQSDVSSCYCYIEFAKAIIAILNAVDAVDIRQPYCSYWFIAW